MSTRPVIVAIRMTVDEKRALETAAKRDSDRSISALGRIILTKWLREQGLLTEETARPPQPMDMP
jgi:hypothetical protein